MKRFAIGVASLALVATPVLGFALDSASHAAPVAKSEANVRFR